MKKFRSSSEQLVRFLKLKNWALSEQNMILDFTDNLEDEIRDYFTSDEYAKHARVWEKYQFMKIARSYVKQGLEKFLHVGSLLHFIFDIYESHRWSYLE